MSAVTERHFTFVYDLDLRRPACGLWQALLGGDQPLNLFFDPAVWLLAPTPGMRLISGTASEWRRAAALEPRKETHDAR